MRSFQTATSAHPLVHHYPPEPQKPTCCEHPTCLTLTIQRYATSNIDIVPSPICPVCKGRDNRGAFRKLLRSTEEAGISRILIVGGYPDIHVDLADLGREQGSLEFRSVDGTRHVDVRRAEALMTWADVVVIWGSTQLKHSVSGLFNHPPKGTRKLVIAHGQRGITSFCREICTVLSAKSPSFALVKRGAR